MYLSCLSIEGYKNFGEKFKINFSKGLNVIVGENASGKTGIIDAVRMLLREDEFGYFPINHKDFHSPFDDPDSVVGQFIINAEFSGMTPEEQVAFLPWLNKEYKALLNLSVENKPNPRGRYNKSIWGGMSKASMFEQELFDFLHCVYLPPLRDAEAKLTEGRGSRLARLIKNLNKTKIDNKRKTGQLLDLEKKVAKFNSGLLENEEISKANEQIRERLEKALGNVFGQQTQIQFSDQSFNRIIENLRLLFFPQVGISGVKFRSLEENSLGYNNIIYLATVLAELSEGNNEYLKILLIEEPEAHLHPQLQIKLLDYLQKITEQSNLQIIVTTHSPVLASSVPINSLIHLSCIDKNTKSIPLRNCGLNMSSVNFVNRWLDATKSTLLFSKGVILVEGIAEALLIPALAKKILEENTELPINSLEEAGIAVINMNGIYFRHFMPLFCNLEGNDAEDLNIPIRCAGLTDRDPKGLNEGETGDAKAEGFKPYSSNMGESANPALGLISELDQVENVKLFHSPLKTLEYDLLFEGNNIQALIKLLCKNLQVDARQVKKGFISTYRKYSTDVDEKEKANDVYDVYKKIASSHYMGKGLFAQILADALDRNKITIKIPQYITDAIIWVCGGAESE